MKLSAEERARLVAATVKAQGSTFEYRFATNNSATTLARLLAEAFAPGERHDRVCGASIVSPASLAQALVAVDAVEGEPKLVRTEAHARAVAALEEAVAPKPHENHAPMRLDVGGGYAGVGERFEGTVGLRLGFHELGEPAVREFGTAGGVLLHLETSVDDKGVVRLARGRLVDLEAFGFEDGTSFGWGGPRRARPPGTRSWGVPGRDAGAERLVWRCVSRACSARRAPRVRALGGRPGLELRGRRCASAAPVRRSRRVMTHGAGPLSLRSEAGVYGALPWSYGTGVFSNTEAFWRSANDYARIARMTATDTFVSPSVGLAIWHPRNVAISA